MTPRIILALPAYNESGNLRPLVESAMLVFRSREISCRIIVVDDGSTDNTSAVLEQLAREYPLSVVTHPENRGLGVAIMSSITTALEESASPDDIIVNMDADNTHDPAYIPQMAGKIWSGSYDVVIASRYRDGSREVGVPLFRRILSRGARLLFQTALRLPDVRDYTCGYRAYRASVLRAAMDKYDGRLITRKGFACTDELLVHVSTITRRMTEVPFVLRYDKKRGRSKLPLMRTVMETLRMLIQRD
ncbi:MAG: glycosyltransferase [bacterium]|nr:glycosyltransferase [Candidatus Sumerlaeota bacterium]